jgi:hypothetical protein
MEELLLDVEAERDRYLMATKIAIVCCASVWPDDFRKAFGDETLKEMIRETTSFIGMDETVKAEDILRDLLKPKE